MRHLRFHWHSDACQRVKSIYGNRAGVSRANARHARHCRNYYAIALHSHSGYHFDSMPTLSAMPYASAKSLSWREHRGRKLLQLLSAVEPARIASDLRGQRRKLNIILQGELEHSDRHTLTSDYCKVSELILRLCRIPQAPAGSKADTKRPTLDIGPEHEVPLGSEVSAMSDMPIPEHSPSETA